MNTKYISNMSTLKTMNLTCTTYKNKRFEMKYQDNVLHMGSIALDNIKNIYFFPCSLRTGDAYLMMVFDKPPQDDDIKVYIFRRN